MLKVFRVLAICLMVVLSAAIVCVWAGYMWLTSENGLQFVKSKVNATAGVSIDELRRDDGRIVFGGVVLSDDAGAYLNIGRGVVDVHLWPLLLGVVRVGYLGLEDVNWVRRPEFEDSGDDAGISLPIERVRVDEFRLEGINIAKVIAGDDVWFDGVGFIDADLKNWTHGRMDVRLYLKGHDYLSAQLSDDGFAISLLDDGLLMRLAGVEYAQAITVKGVGAPDSEGVWRGTLEASVEDIVFADVKMQGIGHGRFNVNARVQGDVTAGVPIELRLDTDRDLRQVHTHVTYGDDMQLSGTLNRRGLRMGMRNLAIVTPYGHVGGRAWYNAGRGRVGANLTAQLPHGLDAYTQDLQGTPVVGVKIRGELSPLNIRADVDGQIKGFAYADDLVMGAVGGNPQFEALAFINDDGVRLQRMRLKGKALVAKASGWMREFKDLDLGYSLSAAPKDARVDIVGQVSGTVDAPVTQGELGGRYSGVDVKSAYDFEGDVFALNDLGVRFDGGKAFGNVQLNVGTGVSQVRLSVEPDGSDVITLDVDGRDWSVLDIRANSVGAVPFEVSVHGDVGASPLNVRVDKFKALADDLSIGLKSPFDVVYDDGQVKIASAVFTMMGGVLNLAADMKVDDMSGQVVGDFSGIRIDQGKGRLVVSGDLKAVMTAGQVDVALAVKQSTGSVVNVKARTGMSGGAAITGTITGGLDLGILSVLPALDGQDLSGILQADVRIAGVNTSPALSGSVSLRNGAYSNVIHGTKLSGIAADIVFNGQQYSLSNGRALDGKGGETTLSGNGRLDGSAAQFDVKANRMLLASTPRLSVTISGDGAVKLSGESGSLGAQITVDQTEVYVSDMLGLGDPYKGFTIVDDQAAQPVVQSAGIDLALDVRVSAAGGVFVRGPGLDSEWGANLQIGGSVNSPSVIGQVFVVRGRYEFVDLVAQLQPQSKAIFTGGIDYTNPELDVDGNISGNGHVAVLSVTGSAQAPKISISSPQGLPADEALAYVMFGDSKGNLSAGQMLRIARVLGALSGRGTGFDPMNAIRRNIGLDSLGVGMDGDGGASLSAGKYLGDGVYVSVEQGTSPTSTAVKTEVDLTETIRLETKVTPVDNSVGIQWRYDY